MGLAKGTASLKTLIRIFVVSASDILFTQPRSTKERGVDRMELLLGCAEGRLTGSFVGLVSQHLMGGNASALYWYQ